jgi:hypothetical protein
MQKKINLNLCVWILLRVWSDDGGFHIRLRNLTQINKN